MDLVCHAGIVVEERRRHPFKPNGYDKQMSQLVLYPKTLTIAHRLRHHRRAHCLGFQACSLLCALAQFLSKFSHQACAFLWLKIMGKTVSRCLMGYGYGTEGQLSQFQILRQDHDV